VTARAAGSKPANLARRRAAPALALLAALSLACTDSGRTAPQAPVAIRGGVVIEPPELTIGQTATVEVAVVTPPDHRLEPFEGPGAVEGLWILGVEQPPPERTAARWVHRVLFRVRSRTTGELTWPAGIAFVGTPDGERVPVMLAERPLRVAEIGGETSERTEPFPYRAAREPSAGGPFLLPALLGGALALAALALFGVVRRARAARSAPAEAAFAAPDVGADVRGDRALEAAIAAVAADPVGAAAAGSAALRAWVAERTGAPGPAATTEELAALVPPFAMSRAWPELLAILGRLDLARFRAGALSDAIAQRDLESTLHAARALVRAAAPAGGASPPSAPGARAAAPPAAEGGA
jgi:hypothetical protein